MGHVQAGAYGALALLQRPLYGVDGGVLHQSQHIGGGKDGDQAGAHGSGGVFIDDHGLGAALKSNSKRHNIICSLQGNLCFILHYNFVLGKKKSLQAEALLAV